MPAVLVVVALTMTAGCNQKQANKLTQEQSKSFDDAAAEIKLTWDKALAADKANDYVTARDLLEGLNQMTLNEQQRATLNEERAAFGQRLMQAAEKNDPAAVQALQAALKNRNRQ